MTAPTWLDDDDDLATTEYNAVMPTVEMHAATMPLPRVDAKCAWCNISLSAIPDAPKPMFGPGGQIVYCHPEPARCAPAYRNTAAGIRGR